MRITLQYGLTQIRFKGQVFRRTTTGIGDEKCPLTIDLHMKPYLNSIIHDVNLKTCNLITCCVKNSNSTPPTCVVKFPIMAAKVKTKYFFTAYSHHKPE